MIFGIHDSLVPCIANVFFCQTCATDPLSECEQGQVRNILTKSTCNRSYSWGAFGPTYLDHYRFILLEKLSLNGLYERRSNDPRHVSCRCLHAGDFKTLQSRPQPRQQIFTLTYDATSEWQELERPWVLPIRKFEYYSAQGE